MAKTKTKPNAGLDLLLRVLDEGYNKTAWHGPNLRGCVARVDAGEAAWRPGPRRRCIAEIAIHCAYWKYSVRRRILGGKRGSFALGGSNWFALPSRLGADVWKGHLRLLAAEHTALREAVAALPPSRLNTVPQGSKTTYAKLIYGIAMHDVYHAGQIRTLRSLYKGKGKT